MMTNKELLILCAKESGIPVEEIAGIIKDEEKGRRFVIERSLIINQLQIVAPKINQSFDEVYSSEFKNISSELSEISVIIENGYLYATNSKDDLLVSCSALLRNAINTVSSSIQTLRCGYRLQSGILLRSAIETCATVTHLFTEPNLLEDFKNDKIKSTYSITVANKKIPLFGKTTGLLSTKLVHINSLHAEWYPLERYKDKNEIPAEVTLGVIGMTIMILRCTSELVYFNQIEEHVYWKKEDEGKVSFIPPSDSKVSWFAEKLGIRKST